MTIEHDDALMRKLRHLALVEPEAARMDRIRVRCHDVASKREQRAKRVKAGGRVKGFLLELALVGAFSLVYLCAIMYHLLRLSAVP